MAKDAETWNLTDASGKHRLMRQISSLPPGLYEVLIKPKRKTRTLNQNAYFHVAIVEPFREWIKENWGENIDHDQAFETLKLSVMEVARVEGLPIMPSTRKLDKAEFSELIENAIQFLATKCDIAVIPPELFFEEKKSNVLKHRPKSELRQQLEGSLEILRARQSSQ